MKREFVLILVVALAAAVLGLAAGWLARAPAPLPSGGPPPTLQPGDRAPAIELPDLDGEMQALDQWRGRPLLVNFWASWCAPCIEEMPLLDALARGGKVQVVGIALDEPGAVNAFLAATPVSYPILLDRPAADDASVRLGNARGVLPYSVLIHADGRVVDTHLGPFDARALADFAGQAR
ncbi:MAG TPA: TlpA disulfide reductase family protein [Xanthomonadaceae bacterium]|nr:TlpA disulfide reductase family protein [Xanthomonadaceae bacterium]